MTNYLIYFKIYDEDFVSDVFIGVNDKSDFDKFVNKFKERGWCKQIIKGESEQALHEISVSSSKAIDLFNCYYSLNNSDFVVKRRVGYSDPDTVNNNSVTVINDIHKYLEYLDDCFCW